MPELTKDNAPSILAACCDHAAALAESLNECLGTKHQIEVGELSEWKPDACPPEFAGPGLVVGIQVGRQWLICLIPAGLPLPDWYATPDEGQSTRLQTLAGEWSKKLLPADLEATTAVAGAVDNVKRTVVDGKPAEEAFTLAWKLVPSGDADAAAGSATLLLVWPVAEAPAVGSQFDGAQPVGEGSVDPAADAAMAGTPAPAGAARRSAGRAKGAPAQVENPFTTPREKRLAGLPITVRVELASKKIELRQLTAISPGSLITFSKSCEDLLDLYINNERYCRGEAIKIGEKFGLKVTEVGVVEHRPSRIIN